MESNTQPAASNELDYNPGRLLDQLRLHLNLKNDAALAASLEVAAPVISKIRNLKLPVGATILIRMHEVSEISIRDLRALMGERRKSTSDRIGEGRRTTDKKKKK